MSVGSNIGNATRLLEHGFDYSATLPTVVTANSSTNTVGSYAEMVSAANNITPSVGIRVNVRPSASGTQGDVLINIATGAAASEQDFLANLWVPSSTSSNRSLYVFDFPIQIDSGVRLSANCQASVSSQPTMVSIQLLEGGLVSDSLSVVDTIGAATATTDGVTVNAAGTINTFGSWTEIIASTAAEYEGFVVAAHKIDGSMTDMSQTYDVAIGSSGNEEIIYSGQQYRPSGSELVHGAISPFIPVVIPSGSRIAIRNQATSTDADAHLDFILYGVR